MKATRDDVISAALSELAGPMRGQCFGCMVINEAEAALGLDVGEWPYCGLYSPKQIAAREWQIRRSYRAI